MTSAPDPGTLSDPASPNGPAEYTTRRRPGFGAAFWASIIVGLILILAGGVIGFFGARLFPVHPTGQRAQGRAATPWLGNPPPPG